MEEIRQFMETEFHLGLMSVWMMVRKDTENVRSGKRRTESCILANPR